MNTSSKARSRPSHTCLSNSGLPESALSTARRQHQIDIDSRRP
ncbi:MAG: hypothetical protein ACRCT1_17020 [Microcoleaceae cyanobacterium]